MRSVTILLAACLAISANEPERAGPDWWSLQSVKADGRLTSDRIDGFVRSRLKEAGLKPAKPAERLALIRRVTFDVTGLPPTPAEIDAFLADQSPDAYAKLVDRLLASPAYGERWARHWLDVVRFSESHGFEYDRLRDHSWPYRDWVIRSLNDDKPYADFVREQLAGDVLPGIGPDGIVATGMIVAGPADQAAMASASKVLRGKAREDELEDIVGTVSQAFLGLTMNCARCHDHKFDPLSARDYYRMKAVFDGVFPGDREIAPVDAAAVELLEPKATELRSRLRDLEDVARTIVMKNRPRAEPLREVPSPKSRWTFETDGRDTLGGMDADLKSGARIERGRLILDGKGAFASTKPLTSELKAKTLEVWLTLSSLDQRGGGAMTVQTLDGGLFDSIVFGEQTARKWLPGSEFFVRTRETGGPDETAARDMLVHIALTYDPQGRITLYRDGQPYGESYTAGGAKPNAEFAAGRSQVLFGLRHTGAGNGYFAGEIEEARLHDRALTADEVEASFKGWEGRVTREEILATMSSDDRKRFLEVERELARVETKLASKRKPRLVYAANVKPHPASVVYKRGDFEKPGDAVNARSPETVKGPPPMDQPMDATNAERRRAFADWVVSPKNPLTWRVLANRVWQHHFGDGLVRTPNDFGFSGERPTHPDLLDALAAELVANGGSLKKLHRLILLSETYRQASTHDAEASSKDADNRLLWRFAPRRLEAEAIRDAMLAVSGKLVTDAGGPSDRPFKVENFNSAFYILFDADRPAFNRRSVYRMNVTSARDPLLDVLDCPDPSVKTPRRSSTTTPLQALTMMNSPFSDRIAKSFADRVGRETKPVDAAYRLALGREPTAAERERAAKVVSDAGLKAVCWALLNSSEFAYLK